ncbi:MAG: GNAT family N-acetyltransferase, partial [Planctomycetota bacterium]
MTIEIRLVANSDRDWIRETLVEHWGSTVVVTRGRVHDGDRLPGLVALLGGARAGLLTFDHRGDELEIVTLNSLAPRQGIGTALVAAARALAAALSCRRLWLVTTNDN